MDGVDLSETPVQLKRLAILYEVVEALGDVGKTQLQKTLYLLQEAYGVPSRYAFRMHHYGPYSEDLDTDMTRLKMTGYLSIKSDVQGYGFHVEVSDKPEQNWSALVLPYRQQINAALELVRDRTPSQLELMATLHFVDRLLGNPDDRHLIETVHSLKPKFPPEYINSLRQELIDADLLGR